MQPEVEQGSNVWLQSCLPAASMRTRTNAGLGTKCLPATANPPSLVETIACPKSAVPATPNVLSNSPGTPVHVVWMHTSSTVHGSPSSQEVPTLATEFTQPMVALQLSLVHG